jgi:ribosome-associated heat shock protein Hsp15
MNGQDAALQRIDLWLFYARLAKSRPLAAQMVRGGKVKLNGQKVLKPGHAVRPGDVILAPQGRDLRLVKVLALGWRRGPAAEAQGLYQDLLDNPSQEGL